MLLNDNFIPTKPNWSPTNLHMEHWLAWVAQVPASLMIATNPKPSPTVCYYYFPNMEAKSRMWQIILLSVISTWYALRLISPTISNPSQISCERKSCSIMLIANLLLITPNLSPTFSNIEHGLRWADQVPISRLFLINFDPLPTVLHLSNTGEECVQRWTTPVSVKIARYSHRLIFSTVSYPL